MRKLRIAIAGYGNIGKGAEKAVNAAPDMELAAVFTRRNPKDILIATPSAAVLPIEKAPGLQKEIDAVILCGGSSVDLPLQGPWFARYFNTVDSYDTHAKIPEYFAAMDGAAKNTVSVISAGWDPGLFSMMRVLFSSVLPDGKSYTFWGRGVSQGHSDAIRRIDGVKNAIQYTVPIESAVQSVRKGENPDFTARQKHLRECYVAAEDGADKRRIEHAIKTMPYYFDEYDATVTFLSEEELKKNHSAMPHGGSIIRSGQTGGSRHVVECSLDLASNPEFTASILVAYARAAVRLFRENAFGAKTVLDIPISYLSVSDAASLRKEML